MFFPVWKKGFPDVRFILLSLRLSIMIYSFFVKMYGDLICFFFLSHRTSTSWNRVIFPFRKKMIFFFAKINGDLIFFCALLAAIFTVFSLRFMAIFMLLFLAFAWQFFPLVPIDSPIVLLHFFVQEIGFVCTG